MTTVNDLIKNCMYVKCTSFNIFNKDAHVYNTIKLTKPGFAHNNTILIHVKKSQKPKK